MKKFLRLLNFEFNRFFKFYGVGLIIIFIGQLAVFLNRVMTLNHELQVAIKQTGNNASEISQLLNTPFSMHNFLLSFPYRFLTYSILIIMFFYLFFTWYRDWLGKNTFIYRLLMLPVNRMQLFWSKSLVFLIGGFAYIAFQYMVVTLFQQIAVWMTPKEYMTVLPAHVIMQKCYGYGGFPPSDPWLVFIIIGLCFVLLTHFFAAILMERAYRLKGLIAAIIYLPLIISFQIILYILNVQLLLSELLLYTAVLSVLSWVISLGIIHYLLKSKVTV